MKDFLSITLNKKTAIGWMKSLSEKYDNRFVAISGMRTSAHRSDVSQHYSATKFKTSYDTCRCNKNLTIKLYFTENVQDFPILIVRKI